MATDQKRTVEDGVRTEFEKQRMGVKIREQESQIVLLQT
jgi:hypothetical protein